MSARRSGVFSLGGRRLGVSRGGNNSSGENSRIVKYTPCSRQELQLDDELEDIAVVSSADPSHVTYGGGSTMANGPRVVPGIITSSRLMGERHSASGTTRLSTSNSSNNSPGPLRSTHATATSSSLVGVPSRGRSFSKQSLLEIVTSRFTSSGVTYGTPGAVVRAKRLSRDSLTAAYVNKAHVSSDLDVSRSRSGGGGGGSASGSSAHHPNQGHGLQQRRSDHPHHRSTPSRSTTPTPEALRRDLRTKLKLERWENGTNGSGSRTAGCKWTFVFDPAGRLCYYWSMVVSLAFLYNFWVLIYRFAFQEITSDTLVIWLCLDYLCDLLYVVDIAFHFRTGYLEDGVLQTDPTKLRQHYMNSTTFYIDCLCLLPLDFLYLSIGFNSILRCFRLVKIYRFWAFMDRTERHTNYPNVFRSVSLVHYLIVIFHWNACLYHIVIKSNGFNGWSWTAQFNPTNGSSLDEADVVLQYLASFYWCTLTLTTIGDLPRPRTKGEFMFVILQLIFGLMLFATILGHVSNIVINVSAARKEFQAKLDGVKTYMRMRRVPDHLQIKVIKWFDYLWLTQKSSDEEKAVGGLPDKLKAEIAIHVHLDTLKRVEIFQNTEAGFLCELVLRLRPVLFSPGDYICRKGEVGKEMYIVNRGRLQVVADDGRTVLATLKAGSYFGEISILNMGTAGNRRTASVRSVGYSDLFVLSKKDMWDVLKEYPAARVRLEAIAVKRLEKYKKAPLENAARSRSHSTPGLVESIGQVPLHQMWIPPVPPTNYATSSAPGSPGSRSRDTRQTLESPLSGPASSRRNSMDGLAVTAPKPLNGIQPSLLGTVASVASCDSDKRSTTTSYSLVASPLTTPATTSAAATGPASSACIILPDTRPSHPQPQQHYPPTNFMHYYTNEQILIPSQLQHSYGPGLDRRASAEALMAEIARLRERLQLLETENSAMSAKLNRQQWEVENRLAEIEMQICGASSGDSDATEDNERNRESAI